ncbi:MAG: hypothetical protein QM645_10640 [Asticcacaulis sp.]
MREKKSTNLCKNIGVAVNVMLLSVCMPVGLLGKTVSTDADMTYSKVMVHLLRHIEPNYLRSDFEELGQLRYVQELIRPTNKPDVFLGYVYVGNRGKSGKIIPDGGWSMAERYSSESKDKPSAISLDITFTLGHKYPSDSCLTYGQVISLVKEVGWSDYSNDQNSFARFGAVKFERRGVLLELRPYARIYPRAPLNGPYNEQSCVESAVFSYDVMS